MSTLQHRKRQRTAYAKPIRTPFSTATISSSRRNSYEHALTAHSTSATPPKARAASRAPRAGLVMSASAHPLGVRRQLCPRPPRPPPRRARATEGPHRLTWPPPLPARRPPQRSRRRREAAPRLPQRAAPGPHRPLLGRRSSPTPLLTRTGDVWPSSTLAHSSCPSRPCALSPASAPSSTRCLMSSSIGSSPARPAWEAGKLLFSCHVYSSPEPHDLPAAIHSLRPRSPPYEIARLLPWPASGICSSRTPPRWRPPANAQTWGPRMLRQQRPLWGPLRRLRYGRSASFCATVRSRERLTCSLPLASPRLRRTPSSSCWISTPPQGRA